MASLTLINLYICANFLLVLAAALLLSVRALSHVLPRPIAYRHQLRWGQAMVVAAVLLPALGLLSGSGDFLPQTAQVWSAPTMKVGTAALQNNHRIAVSFAPAGASMPLTVASQVTAMLFVSGLLYLLVRVAVDAFATLRIISDAQLIRRRGRLRILASEKVRVPFSFWRPARCFIVVPCALLLIGEDLKIAIRHEAQHHRQLDTRLVYLHALLRAVFFWNPAAHLLERTLRELQELACDEALTGRRNLSTRDYCDCLLRTAEAAIQQHGVSVQTSMMGVSPRAMLKRRVEALLRRPVNHLRVPVVFAAGVAAAALMATTALAFASTIHDRRITAEDAARWAAVARQGSTFPIVVNERVLAQLNLLLATPDGRAFLRASIDRMQSHRAAIAEQLVRCGLPQELLAVPLVESGYRNLPPTRNPRNGAGLWMFIPSTAQHFGLIVAESRDDRLDIPAETDAAMRIFASLHAQFNDWGLALLAYNAGSAQVEDAIRVTGSRDVWQLIAQGHENESNYVPRVMAAILIVKNPGVLD